MFFRLTPLENEGRTEFNLRLAGTFLAIWLVSGLLLLAFCAAKIRIDDPTRDGWTNAIDFFCHAVLLSLGFGATGGLVGFLFGIPRSLGQASAKPAKDGDGENSTRTDQENRNAEKTNLEEVSDWLTKIILGAGLTQLIKVPAYLKRLGEYFAPGFENSSAIPILIVMNSLVFGFFAGYVLTQLFLAAALQDAAKARNQVVLALTTATATTSTLEKAVKALQPNAPKETKRTLYERLTYNLLYGDPPEGFTKAIQYAEQYNQEEPGNPSATISASLAAAYGQKYKWDADHKASQEALAESRKRAFEAASKAIQTEPSTKTLLRMMWNPNDPTKVQGEEDDLEVFYADSDFKTLLE